MFNVLFGNGDLLDSELEKFIDDSANIIIDNLIASGEIDPPAPEPPPSTSS
jgi:hypothetical protein